MTPPIHGYDHRRLPADLERAHNGDIEPPPGLEPPEPSREELWRNQQRYTKHVGGALGLVTARVVELLSLATTDGEEYGVLDPGDHLILSMLHRWEAEANVMLDRIKGGQL